MVESLKELNQICQKPRYREAGNWMVRHFLRDAALPLTWLLLHTAVTANQVTTASLFLGLLGILLFALPSKALFLTGVALLQIWYLLDHVDGQIARDRKTASLSGRFFDFMTHHIIHGTVFFSLGLYGYQKTGSLFFVIWGFFSSFSIMIFNLTQDAKYKTFFEKLGTLKTVKVTERGGLQQSPVGEKPSPLRMIFTTLHKVCEIHVLMNILTVAALLEFFFNLPCDLRFLIFLWFGVAAPFLMAGKVIYLIITKKIDREFDELFQEAG